MDIDVMRANVKALMEYREAEGTELGEAWELLCDLWNRADYLSMEISECCEKEILRQVEYCKAHCRIEESEETITRTVKTIELIWDDEY